MIIIKLFIFLLNHLFLSMLRIWGSEQRHLCHLVVELASMFRTQQGALPFLGLFWRQVLYLHVPLWLICLYCLLIDIFFWVSTLLLSDHGNHMLDIFEDRTFTQYKHFFLENGWGNRFYCVPWRSSDLDPHQSTTDDNSRVTGLKNSIIFSRIVKFNGNEQSDGMGIMGSLGACAV